MDTNQNTIQINSFSKGMNSDTSYDIIDAGQYLFGLNIRITNNTLIAKAANANTTENIVTPVYAGEEITVNGLIESSDKILAVASIENVGAIILRDVSKRKWHLYRAVLNDNKISLTKVFTSDAYNSDLRDRFSTVINKEVTVDNVAIIKVYIADGVNPIMQVDINDIDYYAKLTKVDQLISNRQYPVNQVIIANLISGSLKTQQVCYTYRLYKQYGITSRLAPVTNKIQVIDVNRNKEIGNAEDTETSIGFQLKITTNQDIRNVFDHILIFRISYIKVNQLPQINLICDSKLNSTDSNFIFSDAGAQSLALYTVNEFSALNSSIIVPQTIEASQNYMFAANISDLTTFEVKANLYDAKAYQYDISGTKCPTNPNPYTDINEPSGNYYLDKQKYLGGTGDNITWRFITCDITLDETDASSIPNASVNNIAQKMKYLKTTSTIDNITAAEDTSSITIKDYFTERNIGASFDVTYNNIYVSSLLRSLRRDEVYRYGIVFYDIYGNRSNALWIADIRTPNTKQFPCTTCNGNKLVARPLGIEFKVNKLPTVEGRDIIGYQIVRCLKSDAYTHNLLLVALSRPVRQSQASSDSDLGAGNTYRTPYYPNIFMTTQFCYIEPMGYYYYKLNPLLKSGDQWTRYVDYCATNVENDTLYQAFSPEINFSRKEVLNKISANLTQLTPLYYVLSGLTHDDLRKQMIDADYKSNFYATVNYPVLEYVARNGSTYTVTPTGTMSNYTNSTVWQTANTPLALMTSSIVSVSGFTYDINLGSHPFYLIKRWTLNRDKNNKINSSITIKPYQIAEYATTSSVAINGVTDVKNPSWKDGFTDVQLDGSTVMGAIRQYKSYVSNVGGTSYVNWVANGMYNLRASKNESMIKDGGGTVSPQHAVFNGRLSSSDGDLQELYAIGWIGPGPVCLLLSTEHPQSSSSLIKHFTKGDTSYGIGTLCANIQHHAIQYAGTTEHERQFDIYYGFGNYGKYTTKTTVFDGDTYITPAEFVNMFKTYNFNDINFSLQSGQVVYYMPLESNVNTYFDYGMNYKNTANANLQLEPGQITGVSSQERPLHQYNMVYSDNNTSIDMYASQQLETLIVKFDTRVVYSQLKANGEPIDNWGIFKLADYIDADTKHGEITDLLSANSQLYYWQTQAFGKLSVNERSIVTDNNSNVIQLGTGGVLRRTDYITTKYGMRKEDYSSVDTEDGIYWIDVTNKAVVQYKLSVTNYSEKLNVLNILNETISDSRPTINYDVLQSELICKCLTGGNQLIFNTKYDIATSIYTRSYEDTILYNNVMFGLNIKDNKISATKYNYLSSPTNLLSPIKLSFVVNTMQSKTKVFDNQKIVTLTSSSKDNYLANKQFGFTTDYFQYEQINPEGYTDREHNICYAIPRVNGEEYGNRRRGKWMKVDITDTDPRIDFCISHIITKFRQSFS